MDHSAEASMEEILASIRRIIAAEPKAVKAFADEHFQKFSDSEERYPSSASVKGGDVSFGSDFASKKLSQDKAQNVEPSFASLSAPSLDSQKISPNHGSRLTSQSFVQALDDDLAGLIESSPSPRPELKKDLLATDTAPERLSNPFPKSKNSEVPFKGFITSQNIQSAGFNPQEASPASSSVVTDVSKKEPPFYSSLTSQDFLKGDDFLSSPQTSSPELVMSPKELLATENKSTSPFFGEALSQPYSGGGTPSLEAEAHVQIGEDAEKQEESALFELSAKSSPIRDAFFPTKKINSSSQAQSVEQEDHIVSPSSPHASQRTFEDVVTEMLRPMLEMWIEKNLPHLVPKLLKTDNS